MVLGVQVLGGFRATLGLLGIPVYLVFLAIVDYLAVPEPGGLMVFLERVEFLDGLESVAALGFLPSLGFRGSVPSQGYLASLGFLDVAGLLAP
jgi:hypothetical protein